MSLLESATKGWGGGILVGIGAALVAPIVLPAAGATVRPLAKGLIWGFLAAAEKVRELAAETREEVNDVVAEVRSEQGDGNAAASGLRRSRQLGI